jgi:hypothetical protein
VPPPKSRKTLCDTQQRHPGKPLPKTTEPKKTVSEATARKTTAPKTTVKAPVLKKTAVQNTQAKKKAPAKTRPAPMKKFAASPTVAALLFSVADHVEARFGGGEEWYPGMVFAARADGTYQVNYDDGDVEAPALVQSQTPSCGCPLPLALAPPVLFALRYSL